MTIQAIIAVIIFIIMFVLLTGGWLNITVVSLLGTSAYFVLRFISGPHAMNFSVSWDVIFLLVSMMITVAILKETGIFQYLAIRIVKVSKANPILILIYLSLATVIISAFLDNVTTVLMLVPIAIVIATELGISPIPYVSSMAISATMGGTMTMIGDPPNLMIAEGANFGFVSYIIYIGIFVVVLCLIYALGIYFLFRHSWRVSAERKAHVMSFDEKKAIKNKSLLRKSLIVFGFVILGFFFEGFIHFSPAVIAFIGSSILLVISGTKDITHYLHEVEWETIIFFICLFIMVDTLVSLGVINYFTKILVHLMGNNGFLAIMLILWGSAVLSAFINTIPYVAVMIPLIQGIIPHLHMDDPYLLWSALILGANLGSNTTIVGDSANLVSAQLSKKAGYDIKFLQFFKIGFPITIVTFILSTAYLSILYFFKV